MKPDLNKITSELGGEIEVEYSEIYKAFKLSYTKEKYSYVRTYKEISDIDEQELVDNIKNSFNFKKEWYGH